MIRTEKLKKAAHELRRDIIQMIYTAESGHAGGSLSCAEILTVLYDCVLKINPADPYWEDRDRFVLSKGHAAPALYATLARKGFLDAGELAELRKFGSRLQGHPCMFKLPGIEMSTGSLGMGISVGVGMALAARQMGKSYRTYVLCGDGELQEGQNWEALMSAAKWKLNHLTVIVDRNHVQLDGTTDEIMPVHDLVQMIRSFGINTVLCNGHDVNSLLQAFETAGQSPATTVIIAETVKGKGVSFMEGRSEWHGKKIEKAHYEQAMKEITGR